MRITCNNIFLISDLHFGVRSNALEWLETQQDYYTNFFIPYIKQEKKENDVLFVLGDVFDNRQSINLKVLNYVIQLFDELRKILPIYIIIGNHDIHMKTSNDINSLKVLSLMDNITVFEQPEVLTAHDKKILIMPWVASAADEKIIIESNLNCDYMFCHTDISGFSYNKYVTCESGNSIEAYSKFQRVFSGHIHYRQEIGNIIMMGCPYQLTRSDSGNTKGIYKFNPHYNTVEFIKNDYSPSFIKLKLDYILNLNYTDLNKRMENNYVDIIVSNNWNLDFPFSLMLENVKNYKKVDIVIENDIDNLNDYITSDNIMTNFSIMDISNEYIDTLPYNDKLKSSIKTKINELYQSVMEK